MESAPAASGPGRIEVHVRDLEQLFHTLDPSPFLDRSLDREAEEFIVGSAEDIPAHIPLTLIVHLQQETDMPDPGKTLAEAIRMHFTRRADQSHRELRDLFRRGRVSLAIGLPILAAALATGEMIGQAVGVRPLSGILRESLFIGGWVAMWRPMEIFLYDWWPIRERRRLFERLGRMAVRVTAATR